MPQLSLDLISKIKLTWYISQKCNLKYKHKYSYSYKHKKGQRGHNRSSMIISLVSIFRTGSRNQTNCGLLETPFFKIDRQTSHRVPFTLNSIVSLPLFLPFHPQRSPHFFSHGTHSPHTLLSSLISAKCPPLSPPSAATAFAP